MVCQFLIKQGALITDSNPFREMNFLVFAAVSFLFFATFPLSLAFSLVVFGIETTKQLLLMLLEEFLQTLLIMVCAMVGVIGVVYYYVWPWITSLFS
jgi:hypothetical protein